MPGVADGGQSPHQPNSEMMSKPERRASLTVRKVSLRVLPLLAAFVGVAVSVAIILDNQEKDRLTQVFNTRASSFLPEITSKAQTMWSFVDYVQGVIASQVFTAKQNYTSISLSSWTSLAIPALNLPQEVAGAVQLRVEQLLMLELSFDARQLAQAMQNQQRALNISNPIQPFEIEIRNGNVTKVPANPDHLGVWATAGAPRISSYTIGVNIGSNSAQPEFQSVVATVARGQALTLPISALRLPFEQREGYVTMKPIFCAGSVNATLFPQVDASVRARCQANPAYCGEYPCAVVAVILVSVPELPASVSQDTKEVAFQITDVTDCAADTNDTPNREEPVVNDTCLVGVPPFVSDNILDRMTSSDTQAGVTFLTHPQDQYGRVWRVQVWPTNALQRQVESSNKVLVAVVLCITGVAVSAVVVVLQTQHNIKREKTATAHRLHTEQLAYDRVIGYVCHELRNPIHIASAMLAELAVIFQSNTKAAAETSSAMPSNRYKSSGTEPSVQTTRGRLTADSNTAPASRHQYVRQPSFDQIPLPYQYPTASSPQKTCCETETTPRSARPGSTGHHISEFTTVRRETGGAGQVLTASASSPTLLIPGSIESRGDGEVHSQPDRPVMPLTFEPGSLQARCTCGRGSSQQETPRSMPTALIASTACASCQQRGQGIVTPRRPGSSSAVGESPIDHTNPVATAGSPSGRPPLPYTPQTEHLSPRSGASRTPHTMGSGSSTSGNFMDQIIPRPMSTATDLSIHRSSVTASTTAATGHMEHTRPSTPRSAVSAGRLQLQRLAIPPAQGAKRVDATDPQPNRRLSSTAAASGASSDMGTNLGVVEQGNHSLTATSAQHGPAIERNRALSSAAADTPPPASHVPLTARSWRGSAVGPAVAPVPATARTLPGLRKSSSQSHSASSSHGEGPNGRSEQSDGDDLSPVPVTPFNVQSPLRTGERTGTQEMLYTPSRIAHQSSHGGVASMMNTAASLITEARKAISGMRVLVDDVLDFKKFQSARPELKLGCADLRAVSRDTIIQLSHLIPRNVSVRLFVDDQVPPSVVTDARRFRQILTNGLSNALKHARRGPIVVELLWVRNGVYLEVTNYGEGVDMRNIDQMFRPFGVAMQAAVGGKGNSDLVVEHLDAPNWTNEEQTYNPLQPPRTIKESIEAYRDSTIQGYTWMRSGSAIRMSRNTSASSGLGLAISRMFVMSMSGYIGLENAEQQVDAVRVTSHLRTPPMLSPARDILSRASRKGSSDSTHGSDKRSRKEKQRDQADEVLTRFWVFFPINSTLVAGDGQHSVDMPPITPLLDAVASPTPRLPPPKSFLKLDDWLKHLLTEGSEFVEGGSSESTELGGRATSSDFDLGGGGGGDSGGMDGAGGGDTGPGSPYQGGASVNVHFDDMKIVVVDDELINRSILKRFLVNLGVPTTHVVTLEDGDLLPSAILDLRSKAKSSGKKVFVVVLLDIIMKRTIGTDVCAAMRQLYTEREVAIVAATGTIDTSSLRQYREQGFSGVLPKPFSVGDVRRILQHVASAPDGWLEVRL